MEHKRSCRVDAAQNDIYWENTVLMQKSFGNIDVTVIIKERQKPGKKDTKRQDGLNVLIDELELVLNDTELEELLKSDPEP